MSQSLQRQLNWVNFELRLRPSPEILARKQKIVAEMEAEFREHSAILESAARPGSSPAYVPAFPSGEESFRCAQCNRLLSREQLHRTLCFACRTEI